MFLAPNFLSKNFRHDGVLYPKKEYSLTTFSALLNQSQMSLTKCNRSNSNKPPCLSLFIMIRDFTYSISYHIEFMYFGSFPRSDRIRDTAALNLEPSHFVCTLCIIVTYFLCALKYGSYFKN